MTARPRTGRNRMSVRHPSVTPIATTASDERDQAHRSFAHDRGGDTGVVGDERERRVARPPRHDEAVERPPRPRRHHHVRLAVMADREEADRGGEHERRHRAGAHSPDPGADREGGRDGRDRRKNRGQRRRPFRHLAAGQRRDRHGPEEELGLVEIRHAAQVGDEPSAGVEDVASQEHVARLVRIPERAPGRPGARPRARRMPARRRERGGIGARTWQQGANHRPEVQAFWPPMVSEASLKT